MKTLVIAVLSVICVLFNASAQVDPPFNLPPDYEWIAPEPPLPGTVWYDYGWDSSSNGPVPAEVAQAQVGRVAPRAPFPPMPTGLLYAGEPTRLAQAQARPAPPPLPQAKDRPPQVRGKDRPGQFYTDQYIGVATPDFKETSFTYGLGVGYQVSPHWGFDTRISHHGLDLKGSAVQDIGGRLVARMPFRFLSPYTFIGGEFDLERDQWHILPGAGIEITPSKTRKRLALFTEGAIRADLKGRNTYQFLSGLRWRF